MGSAGAAVARAVGAAVAAEVGAAAVGGAGGLGGSGGGAPAQESAKIEKTRGEACRIDRDYTRWTISRQGPLAIVCDSV